MIFKRGKKRKGDEMETEASDVAETSDVDQPTSVEIDEGDATETDSDASGGVSAGDGEVSDASSESAPETEPGAPDLGFLDDLEWRDAGPFDDSEVDDLENTDNGPRIDLGSLVLTGVPGSELRLQIAEETEEIVSAMLIIETVVIDLDSTDLPADSQDRMQSYTSALELGAYAAPRSGGLWTELRDEIAEATTQAGGSVSFGEGPFGVELQRLLSVTTPEGDEGYQPSRMWVAEGPRWLLRGIVYGQAAIEGDLDSPVVTDVVSAFRQIVVRRGDEAMAPGDLLPLSMPAELVTSDSPDSESES